MTGWGWAGFLWCCAAVSACGRTPLLMLDGVDAAAGANDDGGGHAGNHAASGGSSGGGSINATGGSSGGIPNGGGGSGGNPISEGGSGGEGGVVEHGIVDEIAVGYTHTCALYDGQVRCWGQANEGQLGTADTQDQLGAASSNVEIGGYVQHLYAGSDHTCALLDTGAVRCWGGSYFGDLGYGNTNDIGDNEFPKDAGDVEIGDPVVSLALGFGTCALLDAGKVRCWGYGGHGENGNENTEHIGDDETPASGGEVDLGGTAIQISVGGGQRCALLDTGSVRCWGEGGYGQLGYGNTENIGDDETPASAGDVDVGGLVVKIACGDYHTCALLDAGNVRCWGANDWGQLGYGNAVDGDDGNVGDDEAPASAGDVDVGGTVTDLFAGGLHTCALLDTGTLRCWGYGNQGQLGYASHDNGGDDETPAELGDVDVGGTVVTAELGWVHTCALLDTGKLRCWGSSQWGQLGYWNHDWIGDDESPSAAGDVPVF
jgi:alpha-tubulin suppressor-like RCC1 family protein